MNAEDKDETLLCYVYSFLGTTWGRVRTLISFLNYCQPHRPYSRTTTIHQISPISDFVDTIQLLHSYSLRYLIPIGGVLHSILNLPTTPTRHTHLPATQMVRPWACRRASRTSADQCPTHRKCLAESQSKLWLSFATPWSKGIATMTGLGAVG